MPIDPPFPYDKYIQFIDFSGLGGGVYALTTKHGIYIGSTLHRSIKSRVKKHVQEALRNAHANPILQTSLTAMFADNQLIQVRHLDADAWREQYWITTYQKEGINLLNSLYGRARQ